MTQSSRESPEIVKAITDTLRNWEPVRAWGSSRHFNEMVQGMFDVLDAWRDAALREERRTPGYDHSAAFSELSEVFAWARIANWDGEGSDPVSDATKARTEEVLHALPLSIPTPEVGADPGGSLSLDWQTGPNHVFSIAIHADRKLAYAGLSGAAKTSGVEPFDGRFPDVFIPWIERAIRSLAPPEGKDVP